MSYTLVLGSLLTLLVLVGGIAVLFWWVRRPVPYERHASHAPLPLFSHARASVWVRDDADSESDATSEVIAARASSNGRASSTVPSWSVPLPDIARARTPSATTAPAKAPRTDATAPSASPFSSSPASYSPPSVEFSVPTDATLQFLAGRLEILSGSEAGREIRFVRLPGDSETRITFGRSNGAPYRHVQLRDATVSRDHAVLVLRVGVWCLINHSATNPVQVNGVALATDEETPLRDGDRVEMGEVTFRFRT